MKFDKQTLSKYAATHILKVKFQKADGTMRNMKCTLHPSYLPKQTDVEESSTRDNPNVMVVWDIEKDAWRSFRIDSVDHFSYEPVAA